MSVLRNLEDKLAGLVEGTFGARLPVRGAPGRDRAQARARDGRAQDGLGLAHLRAQRVRRLAVAARTASASRASSTRSSTSSSAYLLEHARRERLALVTRPADRVPHRRAPAPRRVRHPGAARAPPPSATSAPSQGDHGHTMVYSTADRAPRSSCTSARSRPRAAAPCCVAEGKRYAVGARRRGARPQPRLRHRARRRQRLAPPRRDPPARRRLDVADLGSTNGVKVNGRRAPTGRDAARAGRPHRARDRRRCASSWSDAWRSSRSPSALKFGFLAVLYLFLLWVARSALKDLRRGAARAPAAPSRPRRPRTPPGCTRAATRRRRRRRRASRGSSSSARPGYTPAWRTTSATARCWARRPGRDPPRGPVRLLAPRAPRARRATSSCSRTSARPTAPTSTSEPLRGPQPLHPGDRIRIGDSEFTYADR